MKKHAVLAAVALLSTVTGNVYAQPDKPFEDAPAPKKEEPKAPAKDDAKDITMMDPAATPPPPPKPVRSWPIELTTLRVLHDQKLISDQEYAKALADLKESVGDRGMDAATLMVGKVATTFYGFVELDTAYDTTQSFSDVPGNSQVARAETYQGNHDRLQFSVRDSRFGFRLKPPSLGDIHTSANLEMDFFGTPSSLPVNTNGTDTITETAFYVNPALRIRHAWFKIETPVVDLLFGQYWNLYGWQPYFFPNTVDLQGLPGQLFSRSPQIRASKTMHVGGATIETALAVSRPVQRDTATPDGQAGIRVAIDSWKGLQTVYAPSTIEQSASIGVSGILRRIEVPEFTADPQKEHTSTGGGGAVDLFLPIIPSTKASPDNGLSIVGEFAMGAGINDNYTGLSGGVVNPALPNPTNKTPAPTYSPNYDPGLAVFAPDGTLHLIGWQTYLIGGQYYLPGTNGRLWVSGNYSHMSSPNSSSYGPATKVKIGEDWFSASIWGDVTSQVRMGFGYSNYNDQYADSHHAINHHLGFNSFFVF